MIARELKMNPDGGYTRQYRRLWEHPAFRSKQEAGVFAWMIAAAQWRETRIPTKFGPVTLGVGELLIAERELAEDFGLHRNTLRALLQRMLDEGIIERLLDRCPHRAGTIIRIANYAAYQGLGHPSEPKEDRSGTTNGTDEGPKEDRRRTKNKEENQGKEDPPAADARARLVEVGMQVLRLVGVHDDPRWLGSYGRVQQWLADGADPEIDIYPTVQRVMARRGAQGPPHSLEYFDRPIADAIASRTRPMPEGAVRDQSRQPAQRHIRNGFVAVALEEAERSNRDPDGDPGGWDGPTLDLEPAGDDTD